MLTFEHSQYLVLENQMIAGENLKAGNLCNLKSDNKLWKASNAGEATAIGLLAMAIVDIKKNVVGPFLIIGKILLAELTIGAIYYIGTEGGITTTAPTISGKIVRVVGYALNDRVFYFKPSETWLEIL